MKRNWKLFSLAIVIVICLASIEIFLQYLFPNYGLEGFFWLFILVICLPIGVGVCFYFFSKSSSLTRKRLWITFLIIGSILLQITIHPVSSTDWSFTDNTWVKSKEYIDVYFLYPNNVSYDDLAFGNEAQMIAASVKYNSSLPDMIAVLEVYTKKSGELSFDYDNVVHQLYFEKRNGEITHDENQFALEEREDGMWLIVNPNSSEPTEYFFTEREFNIANQFSPYSGVGWYRGNYSFYISAHEFTPETGAGDLLRTLLLSK